MPKKVLVALPAALLEQVDIVAEVECRTRSELIREALRRYVEGFRRTQGQLGGVSILEMGKYAEPEKKEAPAATKPIKAYITRESEPVAVNAYGYDPELSLALHE